MPGLASGHSSRKEEHRVLLRSPNRSITRCPRCPRAVLANKSKACTVIHPSTQMQPSARTNRDLIPSVTEQKGTEHTSLSNDRMITLQFISSSDDALPCSYWKLVDRTKPKYDALLGLRGRRPQVGSKPIVLSKESSPALEPRASARRDAEMPVKARLLQRFRNTVPLPASRKIDANSLGVETGLVSSSDTAEGFLVESDDDQDQNIVMISNTEEETKSCSDVESEASNSTVPSATNSQSLQLSAATATPLFGRRAERLAKAAARQAALARLNSDHTIEVSADAHRIASRREDPDFDKDKAVATALGNRARGLRPRTLPSAPMFEEDESKDDGDRDNNDEEVDDLEDSEDDEEEYEDCGDDGDFNLPQRVRHKRRKLDDGSAEYAPGKKNRNPRPGALFVPERTIQRPVALTMIDRTRKQAKQ